MTQPLNNITKRRNIMPVIIGVVVGVTCFVLLQTASCSNVSCFLWNLHTPKLPVVKQSRTLEPFTKIQVSSAVQVTFIPGPAGTAVVETHEDLQDDLRTDVINGTLSIGLRGSHSNVKKTAVELPVERLEKISVSSAASLVGEDTIEADDLAIDVSSAGRIRLAVAAKRLTGHASSAAKMTLSGSAESGDFHASSAARIEAGQLNMNSCKIDASSAASVAVGETKELQISKSSAGSVHYQGTPQVRDRSM